MFKKFNSIFNKFTNKDTTDIIKEDKTIKVESPKEIRETQVQEKVIVEAKEPKQEVIQEDTIESFNLEELLRTNTKAKELFNSLFTINAKEFYYCRKLHKFELVKNRKDLVNIISLYYPEFFDVIQKGQRKGQKVFNIDDIFFSVAFYNNNICLVHKEIDLFSQETMRIKKIGKNLFLTKNTIEFITPKELQIDDACNVEIIQDYQNHFSEIDDILEWIIACRFTESRRQSYLHLRIPAGFGKSFLKELLYGIGISTECRYSDFKSPSSLNPQEFENSLCLIIDEFTTFKKEFKDMTNKMILDSKNQLRAQVQIYSKIFLSAETSNSFTGGVDSQITDRMNVIDKDKSSKLETREVYKKYGSKVYFSCIQKYIYNVLNQRLEDYIELGEIEASNQAEKTLKHFYNQYKLKADNIIDTIKQNFFNKLYELHDASDHMLLSTDLKIKKNIISTQQYIHLKQVKSTFEEILKCFGEDFYKKSRYKINNFEEIFNVTIKNHKIDGKAVYCARFDKQAIIDMFDDGEVDLTECPF